MRYVLLIPIVFGIALMSFKMWPAEDRQRIGDATLWVEQYQNQIVNVPAEENNPGRDPGSPKAVRGILLQDVHSGGQGLMAVVERKPNLFSFVIFVTGVNTANPNAVAFDPVTFKVKVYGVTFTDALQELFTTATIDIESEPDQLTPLFVLAAQDANLPVGRTEVQVSLGNPYPGAPFIPGNNQTEIDKTTDPTNTYTGVWQVTFSGAVTKQFKAMTAEIVPQQSFMLTDVLSYPTSDVQTGRVIPVTDVLDRPRDYPWKVGSKVVCIYFTDVGFGIVGSTFHDMR